MKIKATIFFNDGLYGGSEEWMVCGSDGLIIEDLPIGVLPNIGDVFDISSLGDLVGDWGEDTTTYYVKEISHGFFEGKGDMARTKNHVDFHNVVIDISKEPPGLIKTKFLFLDDKDELHSNLFLDLFLHIRPMAGEEFYFDSDSREILLGVLQGSNEHKKLQRAIQSADELNWNCLITKTFTKNNDRTLFVVVKKL